MGLQDGPRRLLHLSTASRACVGTYASRLMARRRPIDWVNWTLYQRGWILCVLAFVVVLATSFAPSPPPQPELPPTYTNGEAAKLAKSIKEFDANFPDRRPGSAGSLESAQWIKQQLASMNNMETSLHSTTTTVPGKSQPVSVTDVEAVLSTGRTPQVIAIVANRDTIDAKGTGDSAGTLMMIELAKSLNLTTDLRRKILFVSTDAGQFGNAGARLLAQRLEKQREQLIAIINLDRVGNGKRELFVPTTPSGHHSSPVGLMLAARESVIDEGGSDELPSTLRQLLRLGVPVTMYEHGPTLQRGLPTVTLTRADEGSRGNKSTVSPEQLAATVRAVQRMLGTLDAVDSLQAAGKTYILTAHRAYRGWSLKVLIATLLLPVWLVVVDMLVRLRHTHNLPAAVGTVLRGLVAGLWIITSLWLVGATGLFPAASDLPPPAIGGAIGHWVGLILWIALSSAGWILARGPDWQRRHVEGRDQAVLAVSLAAICVLSAFALAVNPFAVIFAIPTLHVWIWLASRRVFGTQLTTAVWAAGAIGPFIAACIVANAAGVSGSAPWYWVELLRTRTFPASLSMLAACAGAAGGLAYLSAMGLTSSPMLPRIAQRLSGQRMPNVDADGIVGRLIAASPTQTRRISGTKTIREPRNRSRVRD